MLLQAAAALIIFAPMLMVMAREIPATILVIVSLLLITVAIRTGNKRAVIADLGYGMPIAGRLILTALVGFMIVSLTWAPLTERAASHLLHFAGAIVLAAISITTTLRFQIHVHSVIVALAIFVTAGLLAIDIWLAGALRQVLSLSTDVFRLNRAAVAITLFLPLASALLATERRFVFMGVLWISTAAAVFLSISYSAKLAFVVVVLVLPIALNAPRIAHRLTSYALPLTVLAMPWIALVANSIVPVQLHEAVGYYSLTIRGEIWQETVPFIWQKPFFGWGVEASHALPHLPEAAHLTQVQRDLLSWGHTHNAPLQIWLELGAVGAALTAAALYVGIRALRALPPMLLPYATTTVIAAFAIACVSHGAWQAWWWALLGLIATAYAMAITAHFPNVLRHASESSAKSTA